MPSINLKTNIFASNATTITPQGNPFSLHWQLFTYLAGIVAFLCLLLIVFCGVICLIIARRRRKHRQQQLPLYQLEYSDDEDDDFFITETSQSHSKNNYYNYYHSHFNHIKPSTTSISPTVTISAANNENTYSQISSHLPPKLSFEMDS